MFGFMDLRWPRVARRSNVGLVFYSIDYIILSNGHNRHALWGLLDKVVNEQGSDRMLLTKF